MSSHGTLLIHCLVSGLACAVNQDFCFPMQFPPPPPLLSNPNIHVCTCYENLYSDAMSTYSTRSMCSTELSLYNVATAVRSNPEIDVYATIYRRCFNVLQSLVVLNATVIIIGLHLSYAPSCLSCSHINFLDNRVSRQWHQYQLSTSSGFEILQLHSCQVLEWDSKGFNVPRPNLRPQRNFFSNKPKVVGVA